MEKRKRISTVKKIPQTEKQILQERPIRSKKYLFFAIVLAAVFFGIFLKINNDKNNINNFKNKVIPEAVAKIVNSPGTKVSIGKISDIDGVYEFELALGNGANNQKYTSYITKDGKILFTSGIKLAVLGTQTQQPTTTKTTSKDIKKSDNPNIVAFIVSNCPFGLQMQRVLSKTISELPEILPYLNVKYIGSITDGKISSMHGDNEAQENLKQICIREEQKDKYWNYVSCYIKAGKTNECLASSGIDTNTLNSCVSDPSKGLKYAQADFDIANKYSIGSSPTLLVNGSQTVSEFDFGGRIPDAIKQIVCNASNKKPEFCSKTLSKDEVPTAFSESDTTNTSNNGGGAPAANCNPAK